MATQWPVEHLRIIKTLLKCNADILARDVNGYTPLHFSAYGSPDVLKTLIKYGCGANTLNDCSMYLDARNKYCETPLFNAVKCRNVPVVRSLLDYGADATSVENFEITSLHKAASFKDCDEEDRANSRTYRAIVLARLLLYQSVDIAAENIRGESALLCAADGGGIAMVKLLLNNGADVNQLDSGRRTPLDIAIFRRDVHIELGDVKKVQLQTVVKLLTAAHEESLYEES